MSLPTVQVTGPVHLPDGTPAAGTMIFTLSGWDSDGGLVAPVLVTVPVTAGAFTADLWPTARGTQGRVWAAQLVVPPGPGQASAPRLVLGSFDLDDTEASRVLDDLLAGASAAGSVAVSAAFFGEELAAASTLYATVAEGLAAVADDAFFFVVAGQRLEMWRRVAGAAVPCLLVA